MIPTIVGQEYTITPATKKTNLLENVNSIDLVKLANKEDKVTEDQIHALWQTRDMVSQYTDEWLNQNT